MVDVFLISPRPDDHLVDRENTSEPLGLSYLASSLESCGFSTEVLDLCLSDAAPPQVAARVAGASTKVVGLSVYTSNLRNSYAIVRALREGGLTSCIVVGGPHVTADPHIVADLGADYGLRGECEQSLVELCKCVVGGDGVGGGMKVGGSVDCMKGAGGLGGSVGGRVVVGGLVCRVGGGNQNQLGSRFCVGDIQKTKDLENLPFPKRRTNQKKDYKHSGVISSRGCPHNCSFCFNAKTGYRQRTPQNIVDELIELRDKYKVKNVDFLDEMFGNNKESTLRLCATIKENTPGLKWNCTTRVDRMDEETINAMVDAGLQWVSVGIESGVEEIRKLNGKNISDGDYTRFFRLCQKTGVKTQAYAILGLPGETPESLKRSKDFIEALSADGSQYNLLDVVPGTGVYYRFLSQENQNKTLWRNYMLEEMKYPIYVPPAFTRGGFYTELERVFGALPFPEDAI